MIIRQALILADKKLTKAKIASAALDAEVLLSYVTNRPKEFLYAHNEKALTTAQSKKFFTLIKRRSKSEPVAYLTHNKEFYGLNFYVDKNVLTPHPETELLVEEVLSFCARNLSSIKKIRLIDVATGSGCIAIALKKNLGRRLEVIASDISPQALQVAKENARLNRVSINFVASDLLSKLISGKKMPVFDIIVANLPYVDKKEIHSLPLASRKTIAFEPPVALYGGWHGLKLYHKLFQQINRLTPLPRLLACEISDKHPKEIKKIAQNYFPRASINIKKDLGGLPRIIIIENK